ncbi:MAG TPA: hypothetical protein VK081_12920, partial [Planctomycetota bacterium]|nr:hypothetical protein [Planctomycetota bacterium]
GSHPTDPRGEMDVVRVVANNGAPQVDNVTRFAAPTSIAEFGYSAVTPDTALDSSFGIKAALSPDGTRIAFLGMGGAGVYVTSSAPDPAPVTVAGASYYSELTFLNAGTVLFFAGPDENAQDLYALDTTTMLATQVTFLGDIRTRGQFWSNNRRFWYFIRSNAASTVNNFVAVDANAASVTLRDVTGSEFSAGTAPSLRTGALNVTTDPWPALEFQLRFVPHTGLAVFAARRTVEPPTDYEDANVFVFDVENGGEATMLTANTGRGADYVVRNIESLVPCGDPPFVAWAERAGNTVATSEDVFTVSLLGGVVRRVSVPDPNGQTIVDGSIRFTSLPAAGVVWAVGQGAALDVPDQNVRVEWSALGTAAPPVRLTPSPVADRVFQVLGTTN